MKSIILSVFYCSICYFQWKPILIKQKICILIWPQNNIYTYILMLFKNIFNDLYIYIYIYICINDYQDSLSFAKLCLNESVMSTWDKGRDLENCSDCVSFGKGWAPFGAVHTSNLWMHRNLQNQLVEYIKTILPFIPLMGNCHWNRCFD